MNEFVKESIGLVEQGKINWAEPLIRGLERNKEHSAIQWVNKIIIEYIEESNHKDRNNWLIWLEELENIITDKEYQDVRYLHQKGRDIFNALKNRNIYVVLISRLYTTEGYYRLGNNKMYIRYLWDILDHINSKFGKESSSECKVIINKYPML